MKRWLSRDAVKLKLGVAVLLVFMGFAAINVANVSQQSAEVQTTNVASSTPVEEIALSEKSKIAVTQTNVVITEEEVPYATTQTYDGTLPKDTTVIRVEGRNGKKVIKTEVKSRDGVETSRALISEEITVPSVAKVLAIGTKIMSNKKPPQATGDCDPNYTPCIKKTYRDLDCSDIGFRVQVVTVGQDPHGFDRDLDGGGCESYPDPPLTRQNSSE